VSADAAAEEQEAFELLLGSSSSSSSSALPIKKEPLSDAQLKAKQRAGDAIGRTRKAYGHLYASLPTDLRPLVADVPQGYAFGIWSFLEKKFRNTEQDNVADLWAKYISLSQEADEDFATYKARVDSVLELLTHAKEQPPPGLYSTVLLWKLQPRYAQAVLALKAGGQIKDAAKIDWPAIATFMANHERSQQRLGEQEGPDERALVARTSTISSSSSSSEQSWKSTATCYNCQKKGHIASECRNSKQPPKGQWKQKGQRQSRASYPSNRSRSPSASGSDNEEGRPKEMQRANAARRSNRYAALSDSESENDEEERRPPRARNRAKSNAPHQYSYLARVLAGVGVQQKKMTTSPVLLKPALSRLKRPGEFDATSSTPNDSKKEKSATPMRPPPKKKEYPAPRATKSLDVALKTTSQAVDTGASCSSTGSRDVLVNLRRCAPMPIKVADAAIVVCCHKGDMPLRLPVVGEPDRHVRVTIKDVYYHERFDANLLSWGVMREEGWELHSTTNGTYLVTPGGKKVMASTRGRLTVLDGGSPERVYAAKLGRTVCSTAEELVQLHRRTGHVSYKRLVRMCRKGATIGMGAIDDIPAKERERAEELIQNCTACAMGKAHRTPLGHGGLDKGRAAGEVLHMDTFYVSMRDPQTGKKTYRYCLQAIDPYPEYKIVATATSRDELTEIAIDIIKHMKTLTGRTLKCVYTDGGSEFVNRRIDSWCRDAGIEQRHSPARTPQLNGIAERGVRTTKEAARTMLAASKIPDELGWDKAIRHHVYLWNRTHLGHHTGVTPIEAMTGKTPSILNVGEFGCDAYVHQDNTQRDTTFSSKAMPGVYLGHDARQNCAVVRMLATGKTIRSKDVDLREGSFKHMRALRHGKEHDVQPMEYDSETLDMSDHQGSASRDTPPTTSKPPAERKEEIDAAYDASDSSADENDADMEYEVEAITAERHHRDRFQYRVKWKGYPEETWELARSMNDTTALDAWEKLKATEKPKTTRTLRSNSSTQKHDQPVTSDDDDEKSPVAAASEAAAQRL
jgi:transposase InsO family protein